MSNRITHIRKPNVDSSVEHITHVKGNRSSGVSFELPVSDVVADLKKDISYYVLVGTDKVQVTHQKSATGREYIKTKPDHTLRDNLLSLPQF